MFCLGSTLAFAPVQTRVAFRSRSAVASTSTEEVDTVPTANPIDDSATQSTQESSVVRAPLRYVGPYPCLALKFPQLATQSQRERNVTGVTLDFILDTAANTNTINGEVAQLLDLEVVGEAPSGVAALGAIDGGKTFSLGDCQLDGIPKDDQFTFMTQLTASALPVANPATAGLLSLSFLQCFEGGVEFTWGTFQDGTEAKLPSITFYGLRNESEDKVKSMVRVPVEPVPLTLLPSVTVRINGVDVPALLDTGSPVTVLNAQAAKIAGIETVDVDTQESRNPFANVAKNFKLAQAASKGEVLMVAGVDGRMVNLLRSESPVEIGLVGDTDIAEFGKGNVYVGDLPGLQALNGLGVDSPPAVVLGMDVLRCRPSMLFRAQTNELFV